MPISRDPRKVHGLPADDPSSSTNPMALEEAARSFLKRVLSPDGGADSPTSAKEAFDEARRLAASGDLRCVVLVRPDLTLLRVACPQAGSIPEDVVERMASIVAQDVKRNIAVITPTGFAPAGAAAEVGSHEWNLVGRTIPFFGLLNGLAYIGHTVWVFDGRASEIEAGCREADVLIIDSEVEGRVTEAGLESARKAMRGASVYVHDRATFTLRRFAPAAAPGSWAAVLEEARKHTSEDGRPQIVLVQQDKTLVFLPCIPSGKMSAEQMAQARRIVPEGMARNIAVMAPTELTREGGDQPGAVGLLEAAGRAIPFFGALLSLASAGNPLWIFDGRPEAVEAGCRGADLLFIDNVLGDRIPARTVDDAAKVMRSDNIVVFDRVSGKAGFIRMVGMSADRVEYRG